VNELVLPPAFNFTFLVFKLQLLTSGIFRLLKLIFLFKSLHHDFFIVVISLELLLDLTKLVHQ